MSEMHGADLVDAITEWVDRADEDLDEHDIEAILRIQLAIDASRWSGVDVAELTQGDVASLKHSLREVDAPEFTSWVVDETLRSGDIVPPRGPARKAPSNRRRSSKKKSTDTSPTDEQTKAASSDDPVVEPPDDSPAASESDTAEPEQRAQDERDSDEPEEDAEPESSKAESAGPSADDANEDEDDLFDAEDLELLLGSSEDTSKPSTATAGGAFAAALDSAPTAGAFAAAAGERDLINDAPADDEDPDRSAGFFAELERNTTTSVTGPAPVELLDAPDALGPSFLPPTATTEGRGRRIGLFALAAVAIVAFVLAGVQLVNNVNDPAEDDVAVEADDADTDEAEGDEEDSESEAVASDDNDEDDETGSSDEDEASAGADDEDEELTPEEAAARLLATPEPTPEPDLPPAEKTAIVLTEDGDIWSIDLFADGFGDPSLLHDSDEYGDAVDVSLVSAGLGIVDEDGDAHITSRTDTDERVRVWRSDRLEEAQTIVEGSGKYAVLDATGSVSVFDSNRAATRISVDTVWDTSEGGTPPARDIDNYIDLIAFSVGDGDVQLVQTSADDNPVFQIWDGDTQPRAFNVDINDRGLFMGVGAGAVARYQWFEDGPPLSAVWDPLAGTRLPAIAYATLGSRTAVVLNNGSVAAIDESGSGPILWDAEVSDLRAVSITTLSDEVLLLLEGGTVLRVAGDGETQNRGSIWDVTDESTSPAIKVLITNP